jgi:hypothetical protein
MNFYDVGDGLNYTDDEANLYLYGQTYELDDGSSLIDGQVYAAAGDEAAAPNWIEKGVAGVENDAIIQALAKYIPAVVAML